MIEYLFTFKKFIKNKKVLLIGGGPSAINLSTRNMFNFEIIIRLNNFKFANDCHRTDVWYSYWGKNIKNVEERIKNEDIKMLVSKYPKVDAEIDLCNDFFVMRYPLFKSIKIPVCYPTKEFCFQSNNPFGISPTCGFAAMFDCLMSKPKSLTIIGFDFFETNIHNFDETWDGSGSHNLELEKKITTILDEEGIITWLK